MSDTSNHQPGVQIAPFELEDAQELATLAVRASVDAYGYSMPEGSSEEGIEILLCEQQLEQAAQVDGILVAKLGNRIVGYTQFGDSVAQPIPLQQDSKELRRLYVATRLHSRGIGRQLMDAALASPVLAPAPQIYLWVWGENTRAINLYENYNFRPATSRYYMKNNGTPTHDLMMVRDQTSAKCSRRLSRLPQLLRYLRRDFDTL